MILRDYQVDAVNAALGWVKKSIDPVLLSLSTGAGKSLIIASVAKTLNHISGGKKILCLAPAKELVLQNREKYLATGNPASIFSTSDMKKIIKIKS